MWVKHDKLLINASSMRYHNFSFQKNFLAVFTKSIRPTAANSIKQIFSNTATLPHRSMLVSLKPLVKFVAQFFKPSIPVSTKLLIQDEKTSNSQTVSKSQIRDHYSERQQLKLNVTQSVTFIRGYPCGHVRGHCVQFIVANHL